MLFGNFDDSGKKCNSHLCLAGLLTLGDMMGSFNFKWRHLLLKHGISEVHMRDLMSLQSRKYPSSWDMQKRIAVECEFIDVITTSMTLGFGAAVDAIHWASLPRDFVKRNGDAQKFCFLRVLRQINDRLVKVQDRDYVSVTFDRDKEYSGSRLARFGELTEEHKDFRDRFIAIQFASSHVIYALQAADILAWETRKHLITQEREEPSTDGWERLFNGNTQFVGEYWDKEKIQELVG
jgi:Protein of unknown function (DUF3800)